MKLIKNVFISIVISSVMYMTFADAQGIYSNNYKVKDAHDVVIKNERAYITSRDLSVILGGSYSYDAKMRSTTIKTDNTEYVITENSNLVSINGNKMAVELRPYLDKNVLMVPVSIIGDFANLNLSWNYKTKNLLISSVEKSLKDTIKYNAKNDMITIKKSVGADYDKLTFSYATTEDVKDEKYMTDGVYYVFKAHERGNIGKKLNGFFYMNVYTNDVYYYPIDASEKEHVKKYARGKELSKYVENGKNNIAPLIATTNMINDVKASNTSLGKFSYAKKSSIDKEYFKELPQGNYYYYQASKKINNKQVPQFDVAQNSKTLEVFLFLKNDKGVNIVKLPDKTIIKTISKK